MKIIIKLMILVLVLVVVAPLLLKKYLFSANPRDLGVKYTPADYSQTHGKIGTEVEALASSASVQDSLVFSGQKEINISLNSSEITAYLNADKYIYAPMTNIQVKINPDGTGEISGLLNLKNFLSYVSLTTPIADIQKAIDKFHLDSNPAFYAKGTVTVTNNRVNFNLQQVEVGRLSIPQKYVSENTTAIDNFASSRLNSIPNLQVRSLTLTDGQVHLDATVPEKVSKVER